MAFGVTLSRASRMIDAIGLRPDDAGIELASERLDDARAQAGVCGLVEIPPSYAIIGNR